LFGQSLAFDRGDIIPWLVASERQNQTIDAANASIIQGFLPPMAPRPDSPAASMEPASPDPEGSGPRRQHPSSRQPDPGRAAPVPITGPPDKAGPRRGHNHFSLIRGWGRRGGRPFRRFDGRWSDLRAGRRRGCRGGRRLLYINLLQTAPDYNAAQNNETGNQTKLLFHTQDYHRPHVRWLFQAFCSINPEARTGPR